MLNEWNLTTGFDQQNTDFDANFMYLNNDTTREIKRKKAKNGF